MTFTKALIAKKIADDCGFMKGEAVEIFEKMLEIMKAKLVAGEDLMMSGFGKWSVKSKHAGKVGTLRLESPWCWMPGGSSPGSIRRCSRVP